MRREAWPSWVLLLPVMVLGIATARWTAKLMPPCLFYERTAFWCPGCGATRAAVAMAEGRWGEALGYHGLFVMGVFGGGAYLVLSALRERFPKVRALSCFRWRLSFLWWALGVILVFTVLRNLPGMEELRPR